MFEQMLSLGYEMEISENKNYGMKGVTVGNTCSAGDKLKLLLRNALKVLLVGFFFFISIWLVSVPQRRKSPIYCFQQADVYSVLAHRSAL